MTIRFWFPALSVAALALICIRADRGQAGSFFGPSCYGSGYTEEYPNRSHNAFGCGPDTRCTARHPLFKHRWFRKNQGVPVNGAPINGAPVEYMPAPVVQTPFATAPVQAASVLPAPVAPAPAASVLPAPVAPAPAVSERIAPIPAPLPAGPVTAQPSVVNQTSKPPF